MFNNKGSVSIEAAISLTVTISVVLTLSLFARVAYVQGVVQHALIQTANEMATYSYFYSLTGLNQINGAVVEKHLTSSAAASGTVDTATEAIENVQSVYQVFTDGKYGELGDSLGKAKESAGKLADINIMYTLKAFCRAFVGEGAELGKTAILNNVTSLLMQTYLPDKDKFYVMGMFLGEDGKRVKDGNADMPIDFSYSQYFSNADADEIKLVAVYDLKLVTPIPIINQPITIAQTAKARAWMASWDSTRKEEEPKESVWDLGYAPRAEAIASKNPALNLPKNFKTISGFDRSSGKASMFVTIDLRESGYSGNESAVRNKIRSKMNDMINKYIYIYKYREKMSQSSQNRLFPIKNRPKNYPRRVKFYPKLSQTPKKVKNEDK